MRAAVRGQRNHCPFGKNKKTPFIPNEQWLIAAGRLHGQRAGR